jgi:hypothetical protein
MTTWTREGREICAPGSACTGNPVGYCFGPRVMRLGLGEIWETILRYQPARGDAHQQPHPA